MVDQGSRNGTSLNGNSLVPVVPAPIRDGDILTLSKELFVVSLSTV
ncbi:FHA domain-containing protein [uncultured Mailhella sp.]